MPPGTPRRCWAPNTRTTRLLGIISSLGIHGGLLTVLKSYVGVLAATILFIATNAGLIGISRLSCRSPSTVSLPEIFSRLHPRYRTPWFTMVLFSIVAAS